MKWIKYKGVDNHQDRLTYNKIYKVNHITYFGDTPVMIFVVDNNGLPIYINYYEDVTAEVREQKLNQLGI
jgi:hypothetical protein